MLCTAQVSQQALLICSRRALESLAGAVCIVPGNRRPDLVAQINSVERRLFAKVHSLA